MEYREIERQRKRESTCWRQASEAQWEKEWKRARARDEKQRRHSFLEGQHEKFVAALRKWEILVAKGENEQQWKKSEQEHIWHFCHKMCN